MTLLLLSLAEAGEPQDDSGSGTSEDQTGTTATSVGNANKSDGQPHHYVVELPSLPPSPVTCGVVEKDARTEGRFVTFEPNDVMNDDGTSKVVSLKLSE